MITVQVFQETKLFGLPELYLGDVLEVIGLSVVTWWGETELLLWQSSGTGLFKKSVELYLGDVLEITGHLAATLGETLHSHC